MKPGYNENTDIRSLVFCVVKRHTYQASHESSVGINNAHEKSHLTLRLLMSYIYGAPSKARNANVVYIWTYVWQR